MGLGFGICYGDKYPKLAVEKGIFHVLPAFGGQALFPSRTKSTLLELATQIPFLPANLGHFVVG